MTDTELVYVRDTSSGRVHQRIRAGKGQPLASYEGCNADQAGAYSVLTANELAEVEESALCRRCFPIETEATQ